MINLQLLLIQSFQVDPEIARGLMDSAEITIEGVPYLGDPLAIPTELAANKMIDIKGEDRGYRVQIAG